MRIAFLITRGDSFGGAQVHVRDMALALRADGHEVLVILGKSGVFSRALEEEGVSVRTCPHLGRPLSPWQDLRALAEISAALRYFGPDLLSTHSSKAGWLGRVAGRMGGVPTLFTAHGWSFTGGLPAWRCYLYRTAEALASPLGRKVITVCDRDREEAIRFKVVPPSRIETVHNGMPDIEEELRADPTPQPPRLVMVARFQEPKDHFCLLVALAGLRHLPWTLDLVGDGPLLAMVREQAASLCLTERVRFLGERKDVATCLSHGQLFILASRREGFPRSILEAMRASLPVIASDVGGIREAVVEGETGFLFPPGEVSSLAARLELLIMDPQQRKSLGLAGRGLFEKRFTFSAMYRRTLEIYRAVLEPRRC